MGVTGLWTVVQPCARPTKIETLNKKRLAIDASIWIYQFLKAVRGKDGEGLRNSHVVGFFQRICKLLFFGIKPVFVFDGGAPALKRQTINLRKSRREGRREDAVRTAGKLLAVQMQRRAEEEEQRRKDEASGRRWHVEEEEPLPENLVYVDELQMTQQERVQNRKFRKKDAYHLPDLDLSLSEMGQPNDPRVMSLEELEQYARQFDSAEDINLYDFSKIDFDGPFFVSLPASDRYNILNAARLRSRLRMGLSKDQLDSMFPDRMAFSRFQIERVTERNELTQRLMHLNGMVDDSMFGLNSLGRVAGEKGREYVLVKNAGVEGGWALGVIGDKDEGERNKPIDVDAIEKKHQMSDEEMDWEDDEDAFEDVPIEGLNRLPKRPTSGKDKMSPSRPRNSGFGHSARRPVREPQRDPNSLFLAEADEDTVGNADEDADDVAELKRAIAMSLEKDTDEVAPTRNTEESEDDWEEVFQSHPDKTNGSPLDGKDVVPQNTAVDDSDEDEMNLQVALAESRQSKREDGKRVVGKSQPSSQSQPPPPEQKMPSHDFNGPLPFETLDLGSSLLGKKKMKKLTEEASGGFEKPDSTLKKTAAPLPPWFSEDIEAGLEAQEALQAEHREQAREADEEEQLEFLTRPRLRKQDTVQVIDLDAEPTTEPEVIDLDEKTGDDVDVIDLDAHEEEAESEIPQGETVTDTAALEFPEIPHPGSQSNRMVQPVNEVQLGDHSPKMSDVTAELQQQPDREDMPDSEEEVLDWDESDREDNIEEISKQREASSTKSASVDFERIPLQVDSVLPDGLLALPDAEDVFEDEDPVESASANGQHLDPDSDSQQYYSDAEDDELLQQLTLEAEEHARFASSLNHKASRQTADDYDRQIKALQNQQKKDRRDADEVTSIMISECQQLLSHFGLPYITAPMEAEAQCAELLSLGLVDGIVTDDSDIFLFGGSRVYKNVFNAAKFVECYLATDLDREFALTRERLIAAAHLLGSDYTEGLPGVGPVTALELLAEFPSLRDFSAWWARVQTGAKPSPEDNVSAFRRKFRKSNAAKLFLPSNFPDPRVDAAYLVPEVDRDPSAFKWGVPDLDALRGFLMATVGWNQTRTDEVLVPVIRDMNRREREGTQANITGFFGGTVGSGTAFAPRRKEGKSRRMEVALERMAERARGWNDGNIPAEKSVQDRPTAEMVVEKRHRAGPTKRKADEGSSQREADDTDSESDYQSTTKRTRRKRIGNR